MQSQIKRYQVKHPLLKKYIKFFWELRVGQVKVNHKLIPQRNINMRLNLSDTPHNVHHESRECVLEDTYFIGLRNKFTDDYLKIKGDVDVLGICFEPDGIYPFLKIPVSEFKNQILGADEIGFKMAKRINEKLKETPDIEHRLTILENELLMILKYSNQNLDNFRLIFNDFKKDNSLQIMEFCRRNNVSIRQLERMYLKYVGLSASTYITLDRFHDSVNQLLKRGYSKLSDLAYDNEYFDQMHFIREFKRFTGNTPGEFINQNNSILQIGKMV